MQPCRSLVFSLFGLALSLALRPNFNELNASLSASPNELPPSWPRAPWTFVIHDGFIEFEYYCRRFKDLTGAAAHLIDNSLTQIATDLRQTFNPSNPQHGDGSWSYRSGVAKFDLHLETESPATKLDVLNFFTSMVLLMRRWDETPVEIGSAVLFVRGTVRASASLTLPGIKLPQGSLSKTSQLLCDDGIDIYYTPTPLLAAFELGGEPAAIDKCLTLSYLRMMASSVITD
ncbi:MAG: hypothetical protein Q9224_001790 [Gallowayella concinna]